MKHWADDIYVLHPFKLQKDIGSGEYSSEPKFTASFYHQQTYEIIRNSFEDSMFIKVSFLSSELTKKYLGIISDLKHEVYEF